ncbi:MAG TPA: phosphoribosylaminoimidazolesuccinocarboxamide synthase [Longimicrobiales bacterium]|nr:phosphoribosylaminoimidazolesuccinocarboxamide synthase [Longimicrobiales bacterium]
MSGVGDGRDGAIQRTDLPFPLMARGKVRDVYDVGAGRLLIVATDRISAYDVVLPRPIPDKGMVLTQVTAWWLSRLPSASPHHMIACDVDSIVAELPELMEQRDQVARRAMLVRRARPLPVECVVRGYLSGSAWREYRDSGTLAGEPLPAGLTESMRLPEPIFSPATKAERGEHDENITFADVELQLGGVLARELRNRSIALYQQGARVAEQAGIIVADTKFEFGTAANGEVLLIDEVLTPDSSRFWPAEPYQPGRAQQSLDKQPVRDWLDSLGDAWDRRPPAPEPPDGVVDATTQRYRELFVRLTGIEPEAFADAPDAVTTGGL